MSEKKFTALVVEETGPGDYSMKVGQRSVDELPPGEVLVRVHYSSLNYKDALSATGQFGITKRYPHTPGIDAAGEVVSCTDGTVRPGDRVIVTSYDLGMDTAGGFGQYIRVPSSWIVPLPDGLTERESMILGTAGLTAALMVGKLIDNGVKPEDGEILVTGASGGVGSIAVAILAKLGYRVVASTGKAAEHGYLRSIGASAVLGRNEVLSGADQLLTQERWAGVVDVAGGATLAAALKATRYDGTVTCCGLADSTELPVSVLPFILRGVSLLGVDSVQCPMEPRLVAWQRLAKEWKLQCLEEIATECTLDELPQQIPAILKGGVRGRLLVALPQS